MGQLMNDATPSGQGLFEGFIHLIDVLTDPAVIILILLIVFRKQIAPHVSKIMQEVAKLLSRTQSARVGSASFDFSPTDLRTLAIENEPELLRRILLQLPETQTPPELEGDDESETAEEADDERLALAALLGKLRQSPEEEPPT